MPGSGFFCRENRHKIDLVMSNRVTERVRELAEEVVAASPVYVVEAKVRGARGSQVVEVFVDSESDLGVDELARISRELGFLMDSEDVIPDKYNLNVSTPGIDRPLADPRQFRKNVGRDLFVQYDTDGVDEEEAPIVHGTLELADEQAIELAELKVSKDKERRKTKTGDVHRIPYGDIIEARVELPW